jgi:hypothetical protein
MKKFNANTKVQMINDHLWNPNPFCSAFAHDGESGYIREVKDDVYVLMLNSKWDPEKPNDFREHEVKIDRAERYFKEVE